MGSLAEFAERRPAEDGNENYSDKQVKVCT